MKLNTVVRLPDGRVGTICYHNLDGCGGVWDRYTFAMPEGGFSDELPAPEFMLREKSTMQARMRKTMGLPELECVGEEYEIIGVEKSRETS